MTCDASSDFSLRSTDVASIHAEDLGAAVIYFVLLEV
jgi:hypothetical protein